jgi:putative membrane protein
MWRRQFNWRMLLMRTVVNALSLLITVALVPNIYFIDRSIGIWIFLAIMLGILNALVKPIIQFLTLRFIFATYGLVLALINGVLLLLLELLFPSRFAINGLIFWPLVGGLVIGISSAVLENLLGLTPPIVSEKYPEVRQRIKDRETGAIEAYITQTAIEKTVDAKQAAAPDATASAAAVLAVVGTEGAAPTEATTGEAVAQPADTGEQATVPTGQEV